MTIKNTWQQTRSMRHLTGILTGILLGLTPILSSHAASLSTLPAVQTTSAAPNAHSARSVVADFYGWLIAHNLHGLPTETELIDLKKFLSADFIYLLHASLAAEERCVTLTPNDLKPRQFEGSLFVNFYEGLTGVISLTEKESKNKIGKDRIVSTQLEYRSSDEKDKSYRWIDKVYVKFENHQWRINDISTDDGSQRLSHALKKYLSKQECGI